MPGNSVSRLQVCTGVALLSASLALAAAPCRAGLILQPEGTGSSLASQGGNIHDDHLAGWLRHALIRDDKANVREAAFLFNSCYGGGMLDDIDRAMGKTVRWTGGSASRHNQYAIGQNSPAENETLKRPAVFVDDRPMSYWTRALVPTMEARDATVFGALQKAATMDQVAAAAARDPAIDAGLATPLKTSFGDVRVRPEEVQTIARNGGDAMKMNCEGCGKRHVVIWAGNTDRMRAFHDVEGMIDVLRTHWPGDPDNVVIKVFYGDGRRKVTGPLQPPGAENRLPAEWGAVPARAAALQRYLEQDLPAMLDPADQFFFYATDHGSTYARQTEPQAVAPGMPGLSAISLEEETLAAALIETANQPGLTIDYVGLAEAANVYMNNALLGQLLPVGAYESGRAEFPVLERDLLLDNLVRIESLGTPFTVTSILFELGQIGSDPPGGALPEPGVIGLCMVAAIAAGRSRRYRTMARQRCAA